MSSLVTCLYPRHVFNKYLGKDLAVPCGHCSACRSLKASTWASRLEMETQLHKYCLFITLTYGSGLVPRTHVNELLASDFVSPSLDDSLAHSTEYLDLNDGFIYHHSVAHIQNFFKRLRISLVRGLNLVENERSLRYFVAFEYGPSGFRPHYHALLWFDSDKVSKSIKEYIFKAWKPNTTLKDFKQFCRINRMSFVKCSASSYVAGYINTDSHVPPILNEKPFRQRHLQSSLPPIGTLFVQQSQIRNILFGDACKIGFVRPTNSRFVDMSLWRGLEMRYFPKCPKFDSFTSVERIAMYKFSSTYGLEKDFRAFEWRFYRQWETVFFQPKFDCLGIREDKPIPQMWQTYKKAFEVVPDASSGCSFPSRDSVKRWFYTSRRVSKLAQEFGCSLAYFVSRIEAYYQRKNYYSLVDQLKFEENVQTDLQFKALGFENRFLPYLIDPLFYENVRKLPTSTYQCYLEQFSVSVDWLSLPQFSFLWKRFKTLYDKIMMQNTKTRVHKEFVSLHPEFKNIYLQNRLYYATFR